TGAVARRRLERGCKVAFGDGPNGIAETRGPRWNRWPGDAEQFVMSLCEQAHSFREVSTDRSGRCSAQLVAYADLRDYLGHVDGVERHREDGEGVGLQECANISACLGDRGSARQRAMMLKGSAQVV